MSDSKTSPRFSDVLVELDETFGLDSCECGHGFSPPTKCPNYYCEVRTAYRAHAEISGLRKGSE